MVPAQSTLTIRLAGSDPAMNSRAASALSQLLFERTAGRLPISTSKEDTTSQDVGAVLLVSLSTPAIVAIARGVADFLRSRRFASHIELENGDRKLKLSGDIADRPEAVEALVSKLLEQ